VVNAVTILSLTPRFSAVPAAWQGGKPLYRSLSRSEKPRKLSGLRTLALAFRTRLKAGHVFCTEGAALIAAWGSPEEAVGKKAPALKARFIPAPFSVHHWRQPALSRAFSARSRWGLEFLGYAPG